MTTILLVEEDRDRRRRFADCLVKEGYEVSEACSTQEASGALFRVKPELIICGARLQDSGQGLALYEIREVHGSIPLVLHVEGSLSENDIRYGLADTLVPQSARPEPLLRAVAELLRAAAAGDEHPLDERSVSSMDCSA